MGRSKRDKRTYEEIGQELRRLWRGLWMAVAKALYMDKAVEWLAERLSKGNDD